MELKEINKILSDIESLIDGNRKLPYEKVVDTRDGDCANSDGIHGKYDTITKVYDLGQENLFLKIVAKTDSYGYNEHLTSIQFVKPVIKQITDFEQI